MVVVGLSPFACYWGGILGITCFLQYRCVSGTVCILYILVARPVTLSHLQELASYGCLTSYCTCRSRSSVDHGPSVRVKPNRSHFGTLRLVPTSEHLAIENLVTVVQW